MSAKAFKLTQVSSNNKITFTLFGKVYNSKILKRHKSRPLGTKNQSRFIGCTMMCPSSVYSLSSIKAKKRITRPYTSNKRQFQCLIEDCRAKKVYGKYIENIEQSWKEHKSLLGTENYESKMSIILGKNPVKGTIYGKSLTKIYKENPLIFHRQKRITEYSDRAHSYSINKDTKFEAVMKNSPEVFRRTNGKFTNYCDYMIKNGIRCFT